MVSGTVGGPHLDETLKINDREKGFRYRNKNEGILQLSTTENSLKMNVLIL